jgi:hypothetical protein
LTLRSWSVRPEPSGRWGRYGGSRTQFQSPGPCSNAFRSTAYWWVMAPKCSLRSMVLSAPSCSPRRLSGSSSRPSTPRTELGMAGPGCPLLAATYTGWRPSSWSSGSHCTRGRGAQSMSSPWTRQVRCPSVCQRAATRGSTPDASVIPPCRVPGITATSATGVRPARAAERWPCVWSAMTTRGSGPETVSRLTL